MFGFIADPDEHIFLKPRVTQVAAREYGFDFGYTSRPNWDTYGSMLGFAATIRRDQSDLRPRDMIDLQSFMWVQGSDEYEEQARGRPEKSLVPAGLRIASRVRLLVTRLIVGRTLPLPAKLFFLLLLAFQFLASLVVVVVGFSGQRNFLRRLPVV